jgi:hypothetical protein
MDRSPVAVQQRTGKPRLAGQTIGLLKLGENPRFDVEDDYNDCSCYKNFCIGHGAPHLGVN